jgi:adenylosuccinate lyase
LIERYTRKEMGRLWSPESRYDTWLQIEIAVCEALAQLGKIPEEAVEVIRREARYTVERVEEIESVTRHDVLAFVECVAESIGPEGRYVHLGVTSSDILDTSLAILLRDASDIIIREMEHLLEVLKDLAVKHKKTIMVGRTHGVHAEPITLGLKFLLWYGESLRNMERVRIAREGIRFGKISGAVGTYAHIEPKVEQYVCDKLDLVPAAVSNQIVQRDRHAQFFTTLAIVAASIEKFALEIRHLQRTEVREAEEGFARGQTGSSSMPHKRNPVLSENLCGLARVVRANAMAALENVALWHERDISHSSVERVIAPDSTILVDFMVSRFSGLLEKLVIHPETMRQNLEKTGGLVFSEAIMLLLVQKGVERKKAYEMVQRAAMTVWEQGGDYRRILTADRELMSYADENEIASCFDLERNLDHVDLIYERVLSESAS